MATSIGSYQGVPIYGGTDAYIQQQMATITQQKAAAGTPVPTGGTQQEMLASGYNSGDPVRKAAAISAGYQAPTTMTPSTLTPTSPFPTVQPKTTSPYPVSTLTTPQLEATPQEKEASQTTSQLRTLYDSLVGKSAYQTEQNTKYGVDAAQKTITDLSTQLTGIKNEAAAIPLQLQQGAADRGVTMPQLGAQQNSRLRTNAIAALGVSTLLSAAQGQLANAQSLADKAVAQKYEPILEKIDALKANLSLILNDPLTSLQDKNRAQAQLDIQNANEAATRQAQTDEANSWKIAVEAASNISMFKPTAEYKTAAQALSAISSSNSWDALQIATETGLLSGGTTGGSGPASVQEYEYAKQQGYTGTYIQYQALKGTQFGTEGGSGGSSTTGSDLADAYAAIQGGADPIAVKRAYLQDHPTASATWDNYFEGKGGDISYPEPEKPAAEKTGLFGWGFLGL